MKRTITTLALVLALTVAVFAQSAPAQQSRPEHLNKQQLNTLIATAKTPAEHERIAQYYAVKTVDYHAQAVEHEAMVAAYRANSSLSNEKTRTSTIGHWEYFVKTFNDLAVKSQELAKLHEEMAKDTEQK